MLACRADVACLQKESCVFLFLVLFYFHVPNYVSSLSTKLPVTVGYEPTPREPVFSPDLNFLRHFSLRKFVIFLGKNLE